MSRRLVSLLLSTALVLSCTSHQATGPRRDGKPTARITVPSGKLLEGSSLTFSATTSSDPDGDSLRYVWNFGDSLSLTGPLAVRSYIDEGSYDVTLIVADQQGESDTATARVSVDNAAPVVSQIVGPAGSVGAGNPTAIRVSASDPGSADALSVEIDWKDGTTSTLVYGRDQAQASATHTYSTVGTYAVELTIQDDDGGVSTRAVDKPIVVVAQSDPGGNRAPTANFVVPSGPLFEGPPVVFDGGSSSDPDGDALTYFWDLGNGSHSSGTYGVSRYADEGTYVVTLIVTDQHGRSDTATNQVKIENAPPFVSYFIAPSGAVLAGTSTTIEVSVGDSGATDSLTLEIDWKDGTTYQGAKMPWYLAGATLAHTYATPGTYAVEATVRDNDGGVGNRTIGPIVVVGSHQNHPPVAHIEGPTSGSEGASLFYSAKNSTDPDGDSLTVTLLSGDGRSEKEPRYYVPRLYGNWLSYPDNGTYVVSVIVADDSGAADTASMAVTIGNTPPTVSWHSVPMHEAEGISGSIQVFVDDSGKADQQTIVVDWGDGSSQTSAAADTSIWDSFEGRHRLGGTVFHAYATTGTYAITVTARDDDGGVSSAIVSTPVLVFNANERQTMGGWEAVDLGTLGGNAARPADFNDRGQIVGTSLTGSWAEHAFLWDESGMHDLGTSGHEGSEAVRINKDGVIAGTAWTHWIGIPGRNVVSMNVGAIWQNGSVIPVDTMQLRFTEGGHAPYGYGRLFSAAPRIVRAINSSGDIAWAEWERSYTSGTLWANGAARPLPSLPMALNDRRQVVGARKVGERTFRAFLADGASVQDLALLAPGTCGNVDCEDAVAIDINESGQIVGLSTDASGNYHFVVWEQNTIKDLGPADWTFQQNAPQVFINDRGEIAGSVAGKAFFWTADTMITLPSSSGTVEIVGMNEHGVVAGTIHTGGEQRVFVWSRERGMVDLGTGPHRFGAAWVVGINARGDVLGYTGQCRPGGLYRCADYPRNPDGLKGYQVRPVLWRNTQASASR